MVRHFNPGSNHFFEPPLQPSRIALLLVEKAQNDDFFNVKQKVDKSLKDFIGRFQGIANQTERYDEPLVCATFFRGLRDKALRYNIAKHKLIEFGNMLKEIEDHILGLETAQDDEVMEEHHALGPKRKEKFSSGPKREESASQERLSNGMIHSFQRDTLECPPLHKGEEVDEAIC